MGVAYIDEFSLRDIRASIHKLENFSLLMEQELESGFAILPESIGITIQNIRGELAALKSLVSDPVTNVPIVDPDILRTSKSLILVEDNLPIATFWIAKANSAGKTIIHFDSPESFLKNSTALCMDWPLVLDRYFRSDLDGMKLSKLAYEMGFQNIFLSTTDHSSLDIKKDFPWIKGIVDKLPNWH